MLQAEISINLKDTFDSNNDSDNNNVNNDGCNHNDTNPLKDSAH